MNETILEIANRAAKAGGEIVANYFRDGFKLVEQSDRATHNILSEADLASENAIVATIREAFPSHAILAEESHKDDANSEHLWIVDPLDGTNNFAHGIPHFAVSIAYYHRGQAECGVVLNPVTDDSYVASKGAGATLNGSRIFAGNESKLGQAMIGVGFYYDRGAMMQATLDAIAEFFQQNIHGIRRFGTASLDLCYVARGALSGFFEYELSPWDFAAGRLIVDEAGGKVTTCTGNELPAGEKSTLLASNGQMHEAMREIAQRHLP